MAKAKKKPAKKRKPAKKKKAAKRKARMAAAKKKVRKAVKKKKAAKGRKAAKRKPARRKASSRRATPRKAKSRRKPNAAFMRPMSVSGALGEVVGHRAIPRTEVTKKLWAYIKKNSLQDNVNRRMINADDKLQRVFGGKKKVSMFEMTKLVSKHMS
jgi:chromatin remodeling complex protein RSC6